MKTPLPDAMTSNQGQGKRNTPLTTKEKKKQSSDNACLKKVKYRYYFALSSLKSVIFLFLYKSVLNGELTIKYKSLNFASK